MKGHKWFAATYDKMLAREEKKFLGAIREDMIKDITGDVLEIGAGTGANFQYYRKGAHVVAIEPDPYMLQRAQKRAANAAVNIDLRQVAADQLPFPDAAFDFVIATLVLCSVSDPRKVLSEIYRVLRPGSEYRLYEHVRYQNPIGALSQDLISSAWQWLGAGCHPNRNTERYVREAGFELSDVRIRNEVPPIPPMFFTRPHLQAIARPVARPT